MSAPVDTTAPAAVPSEIPVITEPVIDKADETSTAAALEPTETVAPFEPSAEAAVTDTVPPTDFSETVPETAIATEEATAVEPAKAIESGVLGYKAPGLIKGFKFSKKHFWLSEEPVSHEKLSSYLRGEKPDVAHPTAAWSSQTGSGLLFFAKQAEEKATPAGILNLAEASDLEKQSPHEFSFKLHGHKHTFKAADDAERDGWYVSIEKTIAEAKVAKEGVVSSEGYKEALAHLSKPVVVGGAASAHADTPRIEEPRLGSSSSSSDEEAAAKKKNQSRSASRNKRSSIFGNLLNKKEDHDVKKDVKKEEKEEAKEEKKEEEEAKLGEPVGEAEVVAAPLDGQAVASRAIDAPLEESAVEPAATEAAPVTESANLEPRPKASKRSSIFGTFFEKVRSPAHEKKESEVAPTVPPKDTVVSAEPPFIPEPSTETTIEGSASPVAAESATTTAPVTEEAVVKSEPVSPRKEKESFFGGIVNRVRAKSPANVDRSVPKTEDATVVPTKTEEAALGDETTPATIETSDEPIAETAKPTTPKENRRKSYFGGGNKISSMFRKPSQAIRGNKDSKKDNVAPATEETLPAAETSASAPAETLDVPTTVETEASQTIETKAEEPLSLGDANAESTTAGEEHKPSTVVSAAA